MAAVPADIIAKDVDLLERRSRCQHLEQLRIQRGRREAKMQGMERNLAGARAARRTADVEGLIIAEREAVQRKQLVAVHGERGAVEKREADVIVQRCTAGVR